MVQGIWSKQLLAEIMIGLKKLELPGLDLSQVKSFPKAAQDAIAANHLGQPCCSGERPEEATCEACIDI